jgi:3-hydroxybutyryl-CoA dehydrogenase
LEESVTTIERITVIGAGTIGRQIALQTARNGLSVTLYDINAAMLERARDSQREQVAAWVATGKVLATEDAAIFERLHYATDIAAAVREADLAIEVVPERVDLKRAVFAQFDAHLRTDAIIATNSSSIRVSLLEDATGRPERVANLHFYLPVWDYPMVEIGGGTHTSEDTLEALTLFARRIDMLPLRVCKESTGFIFNRIWRAIKKEALKVVDSGVASHEDVDRAWMISYGRHNLPPFALMDRIGLDVVKDIEEHYARESGDPSDLPPPILTEKVACGELGQKTGRGFYSYPNPAYAAPDFLMASGSERSSEERG